MTFIYSSISAGECCSLTLQTSHQFAPLSLDRLPCWFPILPKGTRKSLPSPVTLWTSTRHGSKTSRCVCRLRLGVAFEWQECLIYNTDFFPYIYFLLQSYSKTSDFSYPIISDPDRSIAIKLGMIDPEEKDAAGLPLTCRAVSMHTKLHSHF